MKDSLFKKMFGIDLRSLALFRVCVALLVIEDFFSLTANYKAFFSDYGVLPQLYLLSHIKHDYEISIFLMNGSAWFFFLVLFTGVLAAAAVIVGWRTRFASFWMWFVLMSLHVRNPQILTGHDFLLRHLAFWLMFVPLFDKYAWDAAPQTAPVKTTEHSLATVALMLQPCFLYISAVHAKLINPDWSSGQGVYFSLSMPDTVGPFGAYLLQFPQLLVFMNWFTLAVEAAAPALFFIPVYTAFFRSLAIISLAILQAGLGLSLDLMTFPLVSTVATFPFIPAGWWNALASWKPADRLRKAAQRLFARPAWAGPVPKRSKNESAIRQILAVISLFMLISVSSILLSLMVPGVKQKKFLVMPSYVLKANQNWSMFAPKVHFAKDRSWYIVDAILKDGSQMDIFRNKPVNWERPLFFAETYGGSRWRTYICQKIHAGPERDMNRKHFLAYLCRKWNAAHKAGQRVDYVKLWQATEVYHPTRGEPRYYVTHHYDPKKDRVKLADRLKR